MPNLNPKTDGRNFPIIAIHGPSGSGKTRAAATASQYHRLRDLGDRKDVIELKDMLWLQFDKDGLQSLRIHAMEPYFYDFSELTENLPQWINAVRTRLREAAHRMRSNEISVKYVVIDTLSSINDYFDTYHIGNARTSDIRQAYYASLLDFKQLMVSVRALPATQIWLCHSKSIYFDPDKVKEDQRLQQQAQRVATMPNDYDIDFSLTQSWSKYVKPLVNLTMGLDVDDKGHRYFITSETKTGPKWYAKNRYDDALHHREPVDLRAMFARIESFEANLTKGKLSA